MNLLPNHNLAGFLQKKLFAEQRFVLVDKDNQDQVEQNEVTNLEVNEKGFFEQELKDVAFRIRRAIDLKVDDEGYIGLAGTSREVIADNAKESLEELLREKKYYDSDIQGILLEREVADPTWDRLVDSIKFFSGKHKEKLSKIYEQLLTITDRLKDQTDIAELVNATIEKAREELRAASFEHKTLLKNERQDLLNNIASRIEAEKSLLDKELAEFRDVCVEPEALKERLSSGEEIGFFEYIEARTNFGSLLKSIRSNTYQDADVEEASELIQYMKKKVADRRTSVEEFQYLDQNDEERQEVVNELLKGVQKILTYYRMENSKILNPDKAPKSESEKKFVMQLIQFEERLEDGENLISAGEIAFIDDVLTKVNQGLKSTRKLKIQNPEDKTAVALESELGNQIQYLRNLPLPLDAEARRSFKKAQAELKMLAAEFKNDDGELNLANLKTFALGLDQLGTNGQVTGDEESLKKQWLFDKLENLGKIETKLKGSLNSPQEKRANFVAQRQIEKYVKQIEAATEPKEVVEQLIKEEHLKILAAEQFEEAYRKTGVTNSYLVIEQTEYNPQIPNYSGDDWTIYLDAAFYEKLEREEGNFERFKARIAHELAHRRFEVEVRQELEDANIYEHSQWASLKNQFNTLIQGKTVGGDEHGFDSNVNVLNELFALSEENKVAEIANKPLRKLVEEFSKIIDPLLTDKTLGVPKLKMHGAIAETEQDEAEREESTGEPDSDTVDTEDTDGTDILGTTQEDAQKDSEDVEKARVNAVSNFNSFEGYIKIFGGQIVDEQGNVQQEPAQMDIKRIDGGEKLLSMAESEYTKVKKAIDNIDSIRPKSVEDLNNWLGEMNGYFKSAEKEISSNEAGSPSYFQQLWSDTKFLSVDDIFHLATESWEFMQRRRDRNSQDARAAVGQKLFKDVPFLDLLSNEYLSKRQKLEQDEVSEYQGNLSNMSHEEIYPLLFNPKNVDHLKAVINDLCDKGKMRWDDHRVWKSLGKYSFIRIPNVAKADEDVVYRNEWLKKIVADIWDEDTWDGWRKANDNSMNSQIGDLHGESNDLHALGGKPVTDNLDDIINARKAGLDDFKAGKGDIPIIPSHRYQKNLDYAFEYGKLSMEDKFFYLISGVAHRVIPIEYFKKIQSERFLVLPILDFFYAKNNSVPEVDALYKEIMDNGGNPEGIHKMLMHRVLHDPMARKRIEKLVSRDRVREIDHDDWQALMAAVSANDVDTLLSKPNGGKAVITKASMINGMASYSTFVKGQHWLIEKEGGNYNYNNLVDSIKSFVAYDSRIMGRVGRRGAYERLDRSQLNEEPLGHGLKTKDYQESMYILVGKIFEKYYGAESKDYIDSIFTDTMDKTPEQLEKLKKDGMEKDVNAFTVKMNDISSDPRGRQAIRDALSEVAEDMADYGGRNFDYSINT